MKYCTPRDADDSSRISAGSARSNTMTIYEMRYRPKGVSFFAEEKLPSDDSVSPQGPCTNK